jgi:hypothetical protein
MTNTFHLLAYARAFDVEVHIPNWIAYSALAAAMVALGIFLFVVFRKRK